MSVESDMPTYPVRHDEWHNSFEGLTKIEWFAGQALAGLCANPNTSICDMVSYAVSIADEILDELERKENENGKT